MFLHDGQSMTMNQFGWLRYSWYCLPYRCLCASDCWRNFGGRWCSRFMLRLIWPRPDPLLPGTTALVLCMVYLGLWGVRWNSTIHCLAQIHGQVSPSVRHSFCILIFLTNLTCVFVTSYFDMYMYCHVSMGKGLHHSHHFILICTSRPS